MPQNFRPGVIGTAFLALGVLCLLASAGCGTATIADSDPRERNAAALRRAQDNIEQHRKGPARIKIVDPRGRPLANARLEIRQVSHAFKFGCYLKIDDLDQGKLPQYSERFKALFNYAVIGTYWSNIEKTPGIADWSWFDREAALSKNLGLEIAAAPVLWGTNKYGRPRWLPDQKQELLPVLEHRVRSTVTRDPGVGDWEVVNEPLSPRADVFAQVASDEYITSAFAWARDAAPSKRMMINESGVFGFLDHDHNRTRYFALLDDLIRKGVSVDLIGIQAHSQGEWYEPADVARQLELYSTLGKPIQITEFSVQTRDVDDRSKPLAIKSRHRHGSWDDQKQAEFYREFYTIALGSPRIDAIVTWGLDDARAWLPGIGLLDKNWNPKPAYHELDRLINKEWKTVAEGKADDNGLYEFRGFFGTYDVKVETPTGVTRRMRLTLNKSMENEWVIKV